MWSVPEGVLLISQQTGASGDWLLWVVVIVSVSVGVFAIDVRIRVSEVNRVSLRLVAEVIIRLLDAPGRIG